MAHFGYKNALLHRLQTKKPAKRDKTFYCNDVLNVYFNRSSCVTLISAGTVKQAAASNLSSSCSGAGLKTNSPIINNAGNNNIINGDIALIDFFILHMI